MCFVLTLGCSGRGCGTPPLDDDVRVDTGPEETGDSDTDEGTGPCTLPEVEPNGSEAQAVTLPLETTGCGTFLGDLDIDYWLVDFTATGWLSISVDSRSIGSPADPGLLLTSESGAGVHVGDSVSGEDIHLVFPTEPDRYHAMLAEVQSGQGGEGHTYEIMASWAKAPVSYNLDEEEPNNQPVEAQPLESGDLVLGWLEDAIDSDWYSVELPSGKQTLELDIDAWEFGSAGNFKILVYDEDDNSLGSWPSGEMGWEVDPKVTLTVAGNQTLRFRVAEEANRSSTLCWYLMRVTLEGTP